MRRVFHATAALLTALTLSACGPSFASDNSTSRAQGLVDTEVFIDRALTQYGVGKGGTVQIAAQTGV